MFLIETARLMLKPHTLSNLRQLREWENDPEIRLMVSGAPSDEPETLEEAEKYLRDVMDISVENDRLIDYAIHLKKDNTLIGYGQIGGIDRGNRNCLVSICIGEKVRRNRGYRREAMQATVEFCFDTLGMNRIGCGIYAYNHASIRLFRSLGFAKEGVIRQGVRTRRGYDDEYSYGLLREEWEARCSTCRAPAQEPEACVGDTSGVPVPVSTGDVLARPQSGGLPPGGRQLSTSGGRPLSTPVGRTQRPEGPGSLAYARLGRRRTSVKAKELFGHWAEVRKGLYRALDRLTDEQLSFVPREGLWSMGTVACHIGAAEEGWFRHAVTHELDERPKYAAEDYPTVGSVVALLEEVHDRTDAYLETVDVADLDQIMARTWGGDLPLRWVIWHVLEHEIHHRGEIFLMLGLMGIEGPKI